MKKKIKILLTGGSGFFGRNIVELLGDKYEILAPNSKELNLLDTSLVYNFLKKEKVDIVIHAAAVGVARNEKDNPGIVLDNLKMFFNLVRAKKMYKRMIFLGSGAEYNKQQELKNIRESDFDKFHEIIENLKYEEFPEFEEADRSIEAGLCPACGYKITDEKICPECELPLIIEEE